MKLEWRPVEIDDLLIATSLTKREAAVLRRLAKGKRVLEVGSAFGFSTITMALVAEHVDAVDPHIQLDSLNTITHNMGHFPEASHRITLRINSSQAALPPLDDETYDMAFIDGDHWEGMVEHDVRHAMRLVKPGGVIAVHDYDEDTCPGVRPVCDRLLPGGELTDTLWVWVKPEK